MHHLRGGNVINVCLARGQNIWLKVEVETLNGAGVQVEATESAVPPGPGLRVIYQTFRFMLKSGWMHNSAHTPSDVIHIANRGEKPVIPVWEKSSFLYINGINLPVREVPNTRNQVFLQVHTAMAQFRLFKAR